MKNIKNTVIKIQDDIKIDKIFFLLSGIINKNIIGNILIEAAKINKKEVMKYLYLIFNFETVNAKKIKTQINNSRLPRSITHIIGYKKINNKEDFKFSLFKLQDKMYNKKQIIK